MSALWNFGNEKFSAYLKLQPMSTHHLMQTSRALGTAFNRP